MGTKPPPLVGTALPPVLPPPTLYKEHGTANSGKDVTIIIAAAVSGSAALLAIIVATVFYFRRKVAKAEPCLSRVRTDDGEQNETSDQSRLSNQAHTSEQEPPTGLELKGFHV